MNTPLVRHPSKIELEQYGLGRMNGLACDWIEAHVAECDACCAALLALSDDTFVRLAQGAATQSLDSVAVAEQPALDSAFHSAALAAREQTVGGVFDRSHRSPASRPGAQTPVAAGKKATTRIPREIPAELRNHPRYRVLGLIGVGGMGAVFKAEHRVMERLVALKVIHSEFVDNPQAVERFTREVKAAARLAHPNIVAAFDAEQAGGWHFLAMEFVDGVSLDRFVSQQGPLSPLAAARLTRQAALALDHAHQRGMVHRDIKPQNLMLRRGGQLKVLDFGLARLAEGPLAPELLVPELLVPELLAPEQLDPAPLDPVQQSGRATAAASGVAAYGFGNQRTMTGMLLGTPDYLAPEQARDPRSADIRADIYALGCTLFYLLRGSAPFAHRPLRETLLAHAVADRGPLLDSLSDLPVNLRTVLGRMLASHPADRFQTPAQLAKALAKVIAELEAPSPSPAAPAAKSLQAAPAPPILPDALPALPVESQTPGSADHDLLSIEEALVQQAPPLLVAGRGGAAARPGVLIGQGAVEPGRWLPPLRSPMIDVSKTRPMAAVLIAVAVAASLLVGGMWALSGKRENSNGAGDAYVHVGKDSSAAIVGDAVDFANAAHTPHTPNTSGAGKAEAAAQGRNVAMGGRKPGVRAWPYELPENISGRRLVLFVLPKRDLWMPDYGPLRGQLERSKRVKVVTASTEPGPCAVHERSPSPETPVEAITALTPELLSQRDFSAVIFLGYDTAPYISGSHAQAAKEVIAGMASQGKLVGSICLGQTVLAHHQVLLGREAAFGEYLQGRVSESQARWRADQQVVIDRSGAFPVITAATDRDAVALANAILEVLDES